MSKDIDIIDLYSKHKTKQTKLIRKALKRSDIMLTIKEFMEIIKFTLPDVLSVDLMWNTFKLNIPIYITKELVEKFGYKGEFSIQVNSLMKLVAKYNIELTKMNNSEYAEFTRRLQARRNNSPQSGEPIEFDEKVDPTSSDKDEGNETTDEDLDVPEVDYTRELDLEELYPEITKKQLKSKPWHYLIMPNDLKKLLLVVNTEKGDMVREYVIKLDELFQIYMEYQLVFKSRISANFERLFQKAEVRHRELILHIDELNDNIESLSDRLETTANFSVPQTRNRTKTERFILVELNDDDENGYEYYVIRAQRLSANVAFRKLRRKYPRCLKKLVIEYQPNSINLYNRIKERLGRYIIYDGNYLSPDGITHKRLIKMINKVNDERNRI